VLDPSADVAPVGMTCELGSCIRIHDSDGDMIAECVS
jgi:hypothetical protein